MQCNITYDTGMYAMLPKISSEIQILTLDIYHPNILYLRENNLRIRGYFSKQKGAREQKRLGNTGIE